MEINVSGGTARDHSTNLCLSCKFSVVREGHDGKIQNNCFHFGRNTQPTLSCSVYEHKNQADLYDMKQLAWVIVPGREHLGFRPLKTIAKEENLKPWEM